MRYFDSNGIPSLVFSDAFLKGKELLGSCIGLAPKAQIELAIKVKTELALKVKTELALKVKTELVLRIKIQLGLKNEDRTCSKK